MFQLDPIFHTLLFCAGIGATYFFVRANLVRTSSVFVLGSLTNSLFFFLFAIARGNGLLQAGFAGFLLGVLFTGLSMLLAVHFRHVEAAQTEPAVGMVSTRSATQAVSFKAGR